MSARVSTLCMVLLASSVTRVLADAPLGVTANLDRNETGVVTEVSLGGGGDTTGTSYSVVRTSLAAGVARSAPAVRERGLHMCSPDGKGCFWVFTGLSPTDVDGIGADAQAELLVPQTRTFATAEIWGSIAGWHLTGQSSVQPDPGLRAPIWRSGRGIVEMRAIADIPGMWSLGTDATQFEGMPWHIALGRRLAYEGMGTARNAGFDRDISVTGARIYHRRVRFDAVQIRLRDFGLEQVTQNTDMGTVTFGDSATTIDVNAGEVDVEVGPGISVHGLAGLRMLMPVAPFTRKGSSEHSTGPVQDAPTLWADLSYESNPSSFSVGGGTWSRLDPTGHAADLGYLGTAALSRSMGRLVIKTELGLGKLRRALVGDEAPASIAPIGTRMWMGRAALIASYALRDGLAIQASAWAERSDRDDPRASLPSTGDVTSRAGADVSAAWSFSRARGHRQ